MFPRLPKSPPKAGERGAGPFAHAADGFLDEARTASMPTQGT